MISKKDNYRDRFIEGLLFYMAELGITEKKKLAPIIGISAMTLQKIIDRSQKPTIEQCELLCRKAGYSANWLLLGVGEMKMDYQATLNEILTSVKKINNE